MTQHHQTRCSMCDQWYDGSDFEELQIHRHPEPQSGPARELWLLSELSYEDWLKTPDGDRWTTYLETGVWR